MPSGERSGQSVELSGQARKGENSNRKSAFSAQNQIIIEEGKRI